MSFFSDLREIHHMLPESTTYTVYVLWYLLPNSYGFLMNCKWILMFYVNPCAGKSIHTLFFGDFLRKSRKIHAKFFIRQRKSMNMVEISEMYLP